MKQTQALIQIVSALPSRSDAMFWGYEIMQATGLKSGTVYPLLQKLCDEEMLSSSWVGRRRYYHLTGKGRRFVKAIKVTQEGRKLMSAQ